MTNTTKKLVKRNEELRNDLIKTAEQRDALLHCVAQLFDSLDKNTRLMAAHREACEVVREQLLHTNEKVRKIAALQARIRELEADALTMALRLLGENDDTFGLECHEVMRRWGKIAMEIVGEK